MRTESWGIKAAQNGATVFIVKFKLKIETQTDKKQANAQQIINALSEQAKNLKARKEFHNNYKNNKRQLKQANKKKNKRDKKHK